MRASRGGSRTSDSVHAEADELIAGGRLRSELVLGSRQGAWVVLADGSRVLNMCANNYLGLAAEPEVVAAAHAGLDTWGFGTASVRFISGTLETHLGLEQEISDWLGTEDTLVVSSGFDANSGLFEAILGRDDAIISDGLNHASIIDGMRLCKAQRHRYRHADLAALEVALEQSRDARRVLVVTDGVFSMDGIQADLGGICRLADQYGAMVMVDDSHGLGVLGPQGRGTAAAQGVAGRIDLVTSSLGKAIGGAAGGFVSGSKDAVALLRQSSRPYLFSNALAPAVVAGTRKALDLTIAAEIPRKQLLEKSAYLRNALISQDFEVLPGEHPIVPVIVGEADEALRLSRRLLEAGVLVASLSFPVVERGRARLRFQVCAHHERADLDFAVEALVAASGRSA